jgi:hypothetical protein
LPVASKIALSVAAVVIVVGAILLGQSRATDTAAETGPAAVN